MSDEARRSIEAAGQLPDAELDLAVVALHFARLDAPELDAEAGRTALTAIARRAAAAAAADPAADRGDLGHRAAALHGILHDEWSFRGDAESYDDPRNANLLHVLARRRGLPVALGILWLHAAEAAGWGAHGVDFPGHFLVAIKGAQGHLVLDVFNAGAPLAAPELRALIKRAEGPRAELRPGLLAPMGRRAVLLRLQNNIKLRRLEAGEVESALRCAEDMLRLAPDHPGLWREAGLMQQRLERIGAAVQSFERALAIEPEGPAAARVRAVLEELRNRLN